MDLMCNTKLLRTRSHFNRRLFQVWIAFFDGTSYKGLSEKQYFIVTCTEGYLHYRHGFGMVRLNENWIWHTDRHIQNAVEHQSLNPRIKRCRLRNTPPDVDIRFTCMSVEGSSTGNWLGGSGILLNLDRYYLAHILDLHASITFEQILVSNQIWAVIFLSFFLKDQ